MIQLTQAMLERTNRSDTLLLTSNLWRDKVIPPEEKIYLYQTTDRRSAPYLHQQADDIGIVIYYRSVYSERWVIDSRHFSEGRNRKLD